jgi:uncharacterized membrane protein
MNVNRILSIGPIVAVALSLPFYGRTWNLLMHELGAVLFVGNIVVSAVWMALARRSGDPEALRLGVQGILVTDALFTLPGALLVLLNGGVIGTEWFKARAAWIIVSLVLFVLSGIVWAVVLVPVQKRLARAMEAMPPHGPVPAECAPLLSKWFRWGGVATLLPLVTLVLMVVKPRLVW